jgi:hypothetical protein
MTLRNLPLGPRGIEETVSKRISRSPRLIDVLGSGQQVVSGAPTLHDHETRWSFTPSEKWQAGRYRLRVEGTLEDPSGNSVLRPFEVSPDAPQDVSPPTVSYLNFEVH